MKLSDAIKWAEGISGVISWPVAGVNTWEALSMIIEAAKVTETNNTIAISQEKSDTDLGPTE
jgi:hypothetical protein